MARPQTLSDQQNDRLREHTRSLIGRFGNQARLASAVGVSDASLSRFLRGEIGASADLAEKLATTGGFDLLSVLLGKEIASGAEREKGLSERAHKALDGFASGDVSLETLVTAAMDLRAVRGPRLRVARASDLLSQIEGRLDDELARLAEYRRQLAIMETAYASYADATSAYEVKHRDIVKGSIDDRKVQIAQQERLVQELAAKREWERDRVSRLAAVVRAGENNEPAPSEEKAGPK